MAKASVRDRKRGRRAVQRAALFFGSRRLTRALAMVAARRRGSNTLKGLHRFLRQRAKGPVMPAPRPAKLLNPTELLARLMKTPPKP